MSETATSTVSSLQINHIDFAVIAAMTEELELFKKNLVGYSSYKAKVGSFELDVFYYQNSKILLAHTGMGTTFAASVLTLLYQAFSFKYVFWLGTAGGISAHLNINDVVIIDKVYEAEIQGVFTALKDTPFESCLSHPLTAQKFPNIYSADQYLLQIASTLINNTIHLGMGVSSNTFPAPPELFIKIKQNNVYCIDMETSAFYQVAWLLGIKGLALRGISNLLNYDGTDDKVHESNIIEAIQIATSTLWKIIDKILIE